MATNGVHDDLAPVHFTPEQVIMLRHQLAAYKLLLANKPVPADIKRVLFPDAASTAPQTVPLAEVNSFRSPHDVLAAQAGSAALVVPALLPPGLDASFAADERNKLVDARVRARIAELEGLHTRSRALRAPAGLAAVLELKALSLLQRQKKLRFELAQGLNGATTLALPADRAHLRRFKKPALRDLRAVDDLESRQRAARERRAKQKHFDYLHAIVAHGTALRAAHAQHETRFARLSKAVAKVHAETEREEQKRIERVSKERLRALRNDDEESYLKLIDTAKDTRITHLLRQTDSFLESLASAVVAQQGDAVLGAPAGAAIDEAAFGAEPVFADEKPDKVDYYNVAHRIKEPVTAQPSLLVGGELKPYQLKGLEWMISLYNNHVNGILADEMGLGKTIQTISLITYLIEKKRVPGPFLVIVPLSTLPNWLNEFEKWAPAVRVVSYKGTPQQRKDAAAEIRAENFQVLLTTYEYIIKEKQLLARIRWVHMIIDEGHRMKNTQSKLSQTLTQHYHSKYRLILTGTPLQNNLPELWALLNFVLPKIFGSVKSFDEWFNAPFANTGGQDKIEINEEESLLVIRRLHKVLRPFLLRRLKKDVEADLPDKVERVLKCRMSALQLRLTKQIKEHGMIFVDDSTSSKKGGIRGLQNQIMQLKKICNHPYCFEPVERSINPSGVNDDMLFRVAGKFELLDRILPKLFATGHRVLMFFQMTTVMSIFEDYLNFRRIEYLRLDGTTKHEDRANLLRVFNEPNSRFPIFILSTRAGGLGLNLQTADTVVIFDSDWNPHQDLQAQDRAHRIGQKKEVRILRLVTERSVEEHVMAGASRKIEMDKKVIQAGRYDHKSTQEERDEYLRALLEADDEDEPQDFDLDSDELLNEAIARSEDEKRIFALIDKQRNAADAGKPPRLITDDELPEAYRIEHAPQKITNEPQNDRRNRTQIRYDDGLTEDQWLAALEGNGRRRASPSSPDRKRARSESEDEPRRRRKAAPVLSPELTALRGAYTHCIEAVEALTNPVYGHVCAGLFQALPSKKDYPDYYAIIREPVSLREIKRSVNTGLYSDPSRFANDMMRMFANATVYNEEGSVVYEDAKHMRSVFVETYNAAFPEIAISEP